MLIDNIPPPKLVNYKMPYMLKVSIFQKLLIKFEF